MVTSCFSFQGAAEDPQTALALNLDPALMKKKSDPEGPATLLFPERELSIRIGSAGLLSGKPSAADAELGRREGPDLGLVLGGGNAGCSVFQAAHLTAHSGALSVRARSSHLFMQTRAHYTGSRKSFVAVPNLGEWAGVTLNDMGLI